MEIMARDWELEKEICTALDLPEGTFAFDIHAHVGEIWTINVKYNLKKEHVRELIPVLKKFKLVPFKNEEDETYFDMLAAKINKQGYL